jgi:alanine racemase
MRYNTELTVNLSNLAFNHDLLKTLAPKNEIIFMVKANAYGHGLLEVVSFAATELKVGRFGCASLGEAVAIRQALPKLKCEIWVFSDSDLDVDELKELYLDYNIIPVIHNLTDLQLVLSDDDFRYMPLVIKFDTGMTRLGVPEKKSEDVIQLLKRFNKSQVTHLMTHLSSSYLKPKKGNRNERQISAFKRILEQFKESKIAYNETSVSNSGAIEQEIGLEFSHIRPGLMLYGPGSNSWNGKTISSFKTKIIKIMPVNRGTPVGYGGHVCGKDGYIAYLPVGYGDGLLTYYSGAKYKYHGMDVQILGRVNMDLTAIFFEELPPKLTKGSEFIFWDDDSYDINQLAAQLRTISYQLFIAISNRVPRRYIK